MNTKSILSLSFAAALMFSCAEKPHDPSGPSKPQPQTKTLTFTLPTYGEGEGQGLKTAWTAGDKIVVHGEYASTQVVVTLDAADITSDGKTATKKVEGLFPYEREDYGSSLYAEYPADVVDNLKHCFFYSKFSDTNTQILAAFNQGDTFLFEDVCGGVSFTLDDKYDSYTISGLKKETLAYDFLQVKLTDREKNFLQYIGKGVQMFSADISANTTTIFFPEAIAATGCVLKFKKDGEYVKTCKLDNKFSIERGKVRDFGNITGLLKDYDNPFSPDIKDLDAKGNANCYIVTEPGKYKFKAVRGNSISDYLVDVADAVVLWETWNNDEAVTAGSVIPSVSYAEDYMIIHTPAILKPGNAVVAAKDYDGKILWSWHIWVPATEIQTNTYGIFKTALMDRNLGALNAAVAGSTAVDITSCGLMYQWGRKDPFVNAAKMGSGDNATVSGVELALAPSRISLDESIENPTLMGHTDGGDWLSSPDQNLWMNDLKTIYDPCPVGYKVPSRDKSTILFSGSYTSAKGWNVSSTAYWITIGDPVTVFPVAGYRDDYSVDGMAKSGKRTAIWTAHCSSDTQAYHLNWRVDSKSYKLGETAKARACSVRCVAE